MAPRRSRLRRSFSSAPASVMAPPAPRARRTRPKTPPKPRPSRSPSPRPGQRRRAGGSAPAHALLAARRARSRHGRRRPAGRHRLPGRASCGPGGPGGARRRPRWRSPNRPPRRRGGRRRRGTYEEPVAQDVSSLKPDVIRVNSGSTVKDVAGVPRRRRPGGHQEADEPRRDGDAHADAVRRRHPGHRRRVRQGDRDRHGGRGCQRGSDVRGCRRGPRAASAGDHDHGSRRPRQDVAAGRDPGDGRGRGRGRRHHAAHRRLPGPSGRWPRHDVPGHPGPRGVHRHACPRRPGDGHRGDRGRRRRRRAPADARGRRSRQGGRRADRGRGQQDRQGRRRA